MRRCECPCRAPLVGRGARAKYVNGTHAQRAYRERVKAEMRAAGLPASPSLRVARSTSPTRDHNGDAQNDRAAAQRAKPSGVQAPYFKLTGFLSEALAHSPVDRDIALECARAALPARQRERLEARQ